MPFEEENKSNIKVSILWCTSHLVFTDLSPSQRVNEEFFHKFAGQLEIGVVGNCEFALEEVARPDIRQVKSALMGHELRIGDTENYPEEAVRLQVKASKCTALARPKNWKRFAKKEKVMQNGDAIMRTQDEDDEEEEKILFAELSRRTEYYLNNRKEGEDEDEGAADRDGDDESDDEGELKKTSQRIEKEELIRGFKYGASFVPCPDGSFPRLPTKKGIDICGFFDGKRFRRDQAIGEVQYIWADPSSPANQVAMSSVVRAMTYKNAMAIARWVSKDGMDPKMGVLYPVEFENVDCFLWVQVCMFEIGRLPILILFRRCRSQTMLGNTPLHP